MRNIRFSMFEKQRGLQAAGEAYAQWYAQRLCKAEKHLAAREFVCADRFTVADIAVTYALHLSTLNGLDELVPEVLKQYRADDGAAGLCKGCGHRAGSRHQPGYRLTTGTTGVRRVPAA